MRTPLDDVASLRAFNRLYTQRLGLLNDRLDGSPFSLTEARVLYELAHEDRAVTAAEIARKLNLDPAQLSRILARLRKLRLVSRKESPEHAKHQLLSLSAAGVKAFRVLDAATDAAIAGLLGEIDPYRRRRLIDASSRLASALPDRRIEGATLRPPRCGDIGWIVHRQAVLYSEEYGWDWTYEALIAGILGDFVAHFDPAREGAWIAELDGDVVGSVFLKSSEDPAVAKLRLLYVEPNARGRGIGTTLVSACIDRARACGYRRLELWTNSVLVSARRIYEAAGFTLEREAPHTSFGKELVGQDWSLDLAS